MPNSQVIQLTYSSIDDPHVSMGDGNVGSSAGELRPSVSVPTPQGVVVGSTDNVVAISAVNGGQTTRNHLP